MSSYRDYLPPQANTTVIEHTMVWHDGVTHTKDIHRRRPYHSDDPVAMLGVCQQRKAMGVDVRELNWYGPGAFTDKSSKVMFDAAAKVGMQCMINIDKGAYDNADNTINLDKLRSEIKYIRSTYFARPNHFKGPDGKFWLSYFSYPGNEPAKFATIEHENPDVTFHYTDPKYGKNAYGWVHHGSGVIGLETWCKTYAKRTDGIFIPVVFKGFDDTYVGPGGQAQSVWGGAPRVMVNGNERLGQTFLDCWAILAKYYPNGPQYVKLVTANDADEGTTLEDPIENGLTIVAMEDKGLLTWTAGGNFNTCDHLEIVIDDAVVNTVGCAASGTFTLPTNVSLGTHTIYIRAVGKAGFPTRTSAAVSAAEVAVWQ